MEGVVAGAILILTLISPFPKSQGNTPKSPPNQVDVSTTPEQPKKYSVETGDTLDSIAKNFYGSGKYWTTLWNDNDWIEDPRIIKNGWELKISSIKPKNIEELLPKLADKYEELTAPTPTPTPAQTVLGISAQTQTQPSGTFDNIYQQAGTKFGVPWQILYGLHLTETGLRDGAVSSGYGTGAEGPMQFLPQTWSSYGIDGNGDGVADINNAIDAIFGAANYLALHGGIENGLKFYGGDTEAILNAARSRGY
ncbi:MAG: lytic murein transglycosylase [Patescibacteria group bacterium]